MKVNTPKHNSQHHHSPTTTVGSSRTAEGSFHRTNQHSLHNSTFKQHGSPMAASSATSTTSSSTQLSTLSTADNTTHTTSSFNTHSLYSPTNLLATSSSSGKQSFKLQNSAKYEKSSPYDKAKRIMSYILTHCQPNIEGEYSVNQIEHFIMDPNTSSESYRTRIASELLDLLDKMLKIAGVDLYEWIEFAANSYKMGYDDDDMMDMEALQTDKACLNRGQFVSEFNRLCLDLRQPVCAEADIKCLFKHVAGEGDAVRITHCNLDIAMRNFRNTAYKFRKSNAIYKEIKGLGDFMQKLQLHLGGKTTIMNTKVNGIELEKLIFNIVIQFEAFHSETALPTTFEIDKSGSSRSQNSFSIRSSLNGSGSIKSTGSNSMMKKQQSFGRVFANTFASLTKSITRSLSTKKILPDSGSSKKNELNETANASLKSKPSSPAMEQAEGKEDAESTGVPNRGTVKKMDSFQALTRMVSVQHFFKSKQFSDKTLESHDWEDDEVHNTVADLPKKNTTVIKKHVVKRKRFPMGNSLFNVLMSSNNQRKKKLEADQLAATQHLSHPTHHVPQHHNIRVTH